MKKYFSMLVVAALGLFTSCSEEAIVSGGEGEIEAMISITVPDGALTTRAGVEGSKKFVDPSMSGMRVALIVSNEEAKVLNVYSQTHDFGTDGQTAANFKIRFVKGQKYNITAWADFGSDYYTLPNTPDAVGNLSDAVVTAATTRTGSLNSNDCYFKNELIQLTENQSITLTLKRPVALVKVNTTDWNLNEVKYADFRPDFYQVKVTAPTELNLVSGVASNAKEITCSAQIVEYNQDGNPKEMHYDYFFANTESAILPAFTVNYYKGGQVQTEAMSDYTFVNIPVQRNYKTNITGNILTKQGDINVVIDNTWYTPDTEITLIEVDSPSAANTDLESKKSETTSKEYVIKSTSATDNTIIIPDGTQAATLTYNIEDLGSNNQITVKDEIPGTGENYGNDVTLKVPEVSGEKPTIYVNTQSAHVTVIGDANVVYANTSQNTFVVAEGSTIAKIIAQKGNIDIYGTVTSIERANDNPDAVTYVDIYDNGVWTNEATEKSATLVPRRPVAKIGETIYMSMEEALAAAQAGNEIVVTAATVALPSITKSNITIKSTIDTKVTSFAGLGSAYENVTIDGFEFNCTAGYITGKNATVKNCTFKGEQAIRWAYVHELLTIDNCTFEQTNQYAIHFDGADGSVIVNNSTITGTVAIAASLACITFNNCEFAGKGNTSKATCNINIYNKGIFNNCTFANAYTSGTSRGILMLGGEETNSARVTFNGCSLKTAGTLTDIFRRDYVQGVADIDAAGDATNGYTAGTFVTADASLIKCADGYAAMNAGNNVYNIVAGDSWLAYAAQTFESIDKSAKTISIASAGQLAKLALDIQNGVESYADYTVKLTADIDLAAHEWVPIAKFCGTFDGQSHTISNMLVAADNGYGNAFICRSTTSKSIVVKNITFDNATVKRASKDLSGNIYAVVVGYSGYYGNATFEGVTVKNSLVNGYGKVGAIAGMAEMQGNTLSFKDCKVENTTLRGAYNVAGFCGCFHYAVSSSRNTLKFEGTNTSDVTLSAPTFPDRNFEAPTTIEGLTGKYLKCGSDYYAQFATFYCEYGNPTADAKNADAIMHDTADDIIPE